MIEKVVYIAADGSQFEDKKECISYEAEKTFKKLYVYDRNKQRIDLSPENFRKVFNLAYYVLADSYEALDSLNELCDEYGYDTICYNDLNADYNDLFYYSEDDDSWHAWRKDYEKLIDLANHFQITYEYD